MPLTRIRGERSIAAIFVQCASAALAVLPVNDAPTTSPVTLTSVNEDSGARLITQAELLSLAADADGNAKAPVAKSKGDAEIGRIECTKIENKGKMNRRFIIALA